MSATKPILKTTLVYTVLQINPLKCKYLGSNSCALDHSFSELSTNQNAKYRQATLHYDFEGLESQWLTKNLKFWRLVYKTVYVNDLGFSLD